MTCLRTTVDYFDMYMCLRSICLLINRFKDVCTLPTSGFFPILIHVVYYIIAQSACGLITVLNSETSSDNNAGL